MAKTNVLVTCIGGVFSLDTFRSLRADKELDVRIIGVDGNPEVVNRHFADVFYPVPLATTHPDDFIETVLDICQRESVDVLIPCSDEEALATSAAKKRLSDVGVACAVEDHEKVLLMRDKAALFAHVAECGVSMPRFTRLSDVNALPEVAEQMGYPDARFVLKPTTSRGARNFMIVDSGRTVYRVLSEERNSGHGNLEDVTRRLKEEESGLNLMAAEYLPGPAYDVDCVATNGKPLCIVPRRRLWKDAFSPVSQGCRVEKNEGLERLTREIVQAMSLNYAFDLDCGTRDDGSPGLFELNPRVSGSVAAATGGGVNVLAILVRSVLGLPVEETEIRYGATMFPTTRMGFISEDG